MVETLDDCPLFAFQAQAARDRAELGLTRAAAKAERIEPGWRTEALRALRAHALAHEHFMMEDVPFSVPSEADRRAVGVVAREAKRLGWIAADGWAPANTSNRSPKVRWRSLLKRAGGGG